MHLYATFTFLDILVDTSRYRVLALLAERFIFADEVWPCLPPRIHQAQLEKWHAEEHMRIS